MPKLKDGSEWIDHEDCIVGDRDGLRNLAKACEIALEKGEYYGSDLGDYVGVKKLEESWFDHPEVSPETRFGNFVIAAVLIAILVLAIIGFVSIIIWLLP
ncbi:MAG: hypothetical protein R2681_09830 [Pyrinomonadaceae bacterium]